MEKYKNYVHTLMMLFGIGSWVAVNGVFVELPVMVPALPEGWALPSYLSIILQPVNLSPLIVVLLQTFYPQYYHRKVCIYIIIPVGFLACLFLAIFWNYTVLIDGVYHSIPLFVLFALLGICDTTSSVTFLPYMTTFHHMFITSYYIGEGLSGFVPSVLALAQGASQGSCMNSTTFNETTNETIVTGMYTEYKNPRFSVSVFFALICIMMAFCLFAFFSLNNFTIATQFHVEKYEPSPSTYTLENINVEGKDEKPPSSRPTINSQDAPSSPKTERSKFSRQEYFRLGVLIFWVNFLTNGILPSLSTYTSLPYGSTAYHLSASLGAMANPLTCFMAFYLVTNSFAVIIAITLFGTGCATYLIVIAAQSPCPVLVGTDLGSSIMVIMWVLFTGLLSYVKVTTGQMFRKRGHRNSFLWYGAIVQLGSIVGSLIIFPLVNVYYLFQSGDECSRVCE